MSAPHSERSETNTLGLCFSEISWVTRAFRTSTSWPLMTISQADAQPSNATRFLLLANLCRKLGELGCASSLLNPSAGGAVLRVERRTNQPGGVSGAAVERSDGWAYAWDGRWTPVDRVEQLAARLAGAVGP